MSRTRPTPAPAPTRPRALRRGVAALAGLALMGTTLVGTPSPAHADNAVTPVNSYLVVTGSGWGHGIGMSQYGAHGAAVAGLSYRQILAFYYPGTTLTALTPGNTIRVWISADTDSAVNVVPEAGLRVRDSDGNAQRLPRGSTYRQWRIIRSGSRPVLQYYNPAGAWVTHRAGLDAGRVWSFDNPVRAIVKLRLPGGANRDLRQRVSLRFHGPGARTVNTLTMENYLRGVVPSEMPTEWRQAAVQAQAVAARSYAARFRRTRSTRATTCATRSGARCTPARTARRPGATRRCGPAPTAS